MTGSERYRRRRYKHLPQPTDVGVACSRCDQPLVIRVDGIRDPDRPQRMMHRTHAERWYSAVTCPLAGCILTATHRHPELDAAIDFIRRRFDTQRADFLEDPGGWLAYVDAPMTDEQADAAIKVMQAEWWRDGVSVVSIEPGTPEWDASELELESQRRRGG